MSNVRDRIDQWSMTTYGEMLQSRIDNNRYRPGEAVELTRRVLQKQYLTDERMTGDSTSGLQKMEMEVGKFQYVNVFNTISRARDWCPVDMVYGTCYLALKDPNVAKKARQWGMTQEELISQMCGRALRALPSYLREHDLRQQIELRFPNARFEQNQGLDTILHADLMMEYNGDNYYFWSFLSTPRSLENFQDKFLGHRQGYIPDGYHVTCPFSLNEGEDIDGWKLYDPLSVSAIARMIRNPVHAGYEDVEGLAEFNHRYFQTPKLIFKSDDKERVMEQEEEFDLVR